MKPIKVFFDKVGYTLNVWFDDPQKEHTSEEVVLVEDIDGKLIGFEVLNYLSGDEAKNVTVVPIESAVVN
jgi:hypothetical protein